MPEAAEAPEGVDVIHKAFRSRLWSLTFGAKKRSSGGTEAAMEGPKQLQPPAAACANDRRHQCRPNARSEQRAGECTSAAQQAVTKVLRFECWLAVAADRPPWTPSDHQQMLWFGLWVFQRLCTTLLAHCSATAASSPHSLLSDPAACSIGCKYTQTRPLSRREVNTARPSCRSFLRPLHPAEGMPENQGCDISQHLRRCRKLSCLGQHSTQVIKPPDPAGSALAARYVRGPAQRCHSRSQEETERRRVSPGMCCTANLAYQLSRYSRLLGC